MPVTGWERFTDTFFKPELIAATWPKIVSGMAVTLQVAGLVLITGIAAGLTLAAIRAYGVRPVNALIIVFADLMRAMPPLVLVLIAYFGLPNIGLTLSGFVVLWLVLSLVLAAFAEEIFWAGITSIRKGQWDAARSTGLTFTQTLLNVILPQAVRLTIPPLTNRTIAITKNTALGTVIGVPEILNQATTAVSFSGNATPLTMGAIAYLVIFVPVVLAGRGIEQRFHWRRA
jgi:polar amino acid transport system permease protein